MKILITGASGFIGGAVVKNLLKDDKNVIFALVSKNSLQEFKSTYNDKVEIIVGDLEFFCNNDIEEHFDVCIHCAWITTPGYYLEAKENLYFLKWSKIFIEKLIKLKIKHFTILGTCIEYELGNNPLTEDQSPIKSISLYAKCKNELHLYASEICNANDITLCWGRVFYPYGIGEPKLKLCSHIINKLKNNEKLVLKTPYAKKDYIYIDDLAEAVSICSKKMYNGEINLANGEGVSVVEIAYIISEILGVSKKLIELKPIDSQEKDVIASNNKLKKLSWTTKKSLKENLKSMISVS